MPSRVCLLRCELSEAGALPAGCDARGGSVRVALGRGGSEARGVAVAAGGSERWGITGAMPRRVLLRSGLLTTGVTVAEAGDEGRAAGVDATGDEGRAAATGGGSGAGGYDAGAAAAGGLEGAGAGAAAGVATWGTRAAAGISSAPHSESMSS